MYSDQSVHGKRRKFSELPTINCATVGARLTVLGGGIGTPIARDPIFAPNASRVAPKLDTEGFILSHECSERLYSPVNAKLQILIIEAKLSSTTHHQISWQKAYVSKRHDKNHLAVEQLHCSLDGSFFTCTEPTNSFNCEVDTPEFSSSLSRVSLLSQRESVHCQVDDVLVEFLDLTAHSNL